MISPKSARIPLDPDLVGSIPPRSLSDDSGELEDARTLLIDRPSTRTMELRPGDVIEELDPRQPASVPPVGFDSCDLVIPRHRVAPYLLGGAGAIAAIVLAVAFDAPRTEPAPARAATSPTVAAPARAPAPSPSAAPSAVPFAPSTKLGTLRFADELQGQRAYVDGVVVTARASVVTCGPHEVALWSLDHHRTIDVPCGGEVTVYR